MTPAEAFAALHSGPTAVMSFSDARRLVSLELEMSPFDFDPARLTPEQAPRFWEAVEIIRSYEEVRHIVEQDPPPSWASMTDEVAALLAPKKRAKAKAKPKTKEERTVAAQNSLWKRASY